ncbi:hypothetical protein [Thermomonas sp.]|uniref:hypothetical protein n=1 Tax=Thermomonas sp. TaxID=1971895 RepID=UPI002636C771|nr:hypothetical protein [Thermomonas sp.]
MLLLIPFQPAQSQSSERTGDIPLVTRHRNIETDSLGEGRLAARYRVAESVEPTGPHLAQAIALYKNGPSSAPGILRELDLEIEDFPNGVSSRVLKARTLKGVNRCQEALTVLAELEAITSKNGEIVGDAELLRAECLYFTGSYLEANQTLNAYNAFFQANPTSRMKYEQLAAAVQMALSGKRDQP